MIRLGDLELGERPAVAVSFTDADGKGEIAAAKAAGVAVAELRIDLFARVTPDYVLLQADRLSGLPTIATIRIAVEGGGWKKSEGERLALFEAVLPSVAGIDVELAAAETLAAIAPLTRAKKRRLIVSHHDFQKTPPLEALKDVVSRAVDAGADVVKIATQINADEDVDILSRLLADKGAPGLIVIGMGEKGLATRLAFPLRGSLITYAAKGERATAPGQLSYERTLKLLSDLEPQGETS